MPFKIIKKFVSSSTTFISGSQPLSLSKIIRTGLGILLERGCHFIIKRNLRKESKEDWLRMAKDNSLDITHPRDGKGVYIGSDWKEITYQAIRQVRDQ